jgi:hypothetical protein
VCGPPAALTFPAFEFSMCKHVHSAEWCLAGPAGLEPASTSVLETGARPIELRPIGNSVVKKETAHQGISPEGGACVCGLFGYIVGTMPRVALSNVWHEKALCFPRSMLGDQVYTVRPFVVMRSYSE